MQEVILFYKGLDVPTRQILDTKGAVPKINIVDAKKSIQEMANHSQKWYNGTSTRCRSSDTSDGLAAIQAQLNNLGREIKKVNEKVVPFPQGGRYRAAALGFYQRDSGNPLYQERRKIMEESLRKFMAESAKRHDENSNLIKDIRASTDAAIRNQGASIKALEIQIGDHVKSISTCEKAETPLIRHIGSHRYGVSSQQKDDRMSLIELNRAAIPFSGRLRQYGNDMEEIKATMNSHCSTILDDALPPKEKDP
ncbi:hypothetical protein Tco_0751170 [Tanacetum coccineum]|uniref:Uncharacterized protein n=1 Tax=Tanacetum coccineum TaxID=301880 RepID=A0ABQ4Z3B3_9ASTR